jgi:hypothetical protein
VDADLVEAAPSPDGPVVTVSAATRGPDGRFAPKHAEVDIPAEPAEAPAPAKRADSPATVTAVGHQFRRGTFGYALAVEYLERNPDADRQGWPDGAR